MQYTVCTLVTQFEQYNKMKSSFVAAGFHESDCEYLVIDNSKENTTDAYHGYNQLIEKAKGRYIIFCHQDIQLNYSNRADLELRITEIEKMDNRWAVLSNCGATGILEYALRVTEGDGVERNTNNFPSRVNSVDEHFFLVKASTKVQFSKRLNGFHFYGTDICLSAKKGGYTSYVIDFHLSHLGGGTVDEAFYKCKENLINEYAERLPGLGWIQTTCARIYISDNQIKNKIYNSNFPNYLVKKYHKIRRALSISG